MTAEWAPMDRLTTGASIALAVQTDAETVGVFQTTTAGAGLRVWRELVISAGLGLRIRLRDTDDLGRATGLAATGALYWQLPRARVGVAAGAGLNDQAHELFGHLSVGVFVDLAFKGS